MTNETTLTDESGYDAHWKAWIAKGLKQDSVNRSRATAVAVSVATALVLWLAGLVALG